MEDSREIKLLQQIIDISEERTAYMRILNDMAEELLETKNPFKFLFGGRFYWKYFYRYRDIQKKYYE